MNNACLKIRKTGDILTLCRNERDDIEYTVLIQVVILRAFDCRHLPGARVYLRNRAE